MIEAPTRERTKTRTTRGVWPPQEVSTGRSRAAYDWFLELPKALVIAVLWLMGMALLGLCGLALYLAETVLT